MKKLAIVFIMILSVAAPTFAAGYCPTPSEYRAKMEYFQLKAIRLMATPSSNLDEAEALTREQDTYMDSTFPGCMQYFQTTQVPDCSKLQVLSTSYIMLDKAKKPAAKAQIDRLPQSLRTRCEIDYQTLQFMIK